MSAKEDFDKQFEETLYPNGLVYFYQMDEHSFKLCCKMWYIKGRLDQAELNSDVLHKP